MSYCQLASLLLMISFQALTEIAKQRQKYGLLSALDEEKARHYMEARLAEKKERTWHQKKPMKAVLYETREYVDKSSGRRVKETAV